MFFYRNPPRFNTASKTPQPTQTLNIHKSGIPAIFLDPNNGGNAIFRDNNGKPTITLHSIHNAGRLYIHDKTGQPVIDLHTTDTGGTVVATAITGKAIAILGIDKNNKGFTKTM